MGNKHKHYDMIVAKAANFDLIQFIKLGDKWEIVGGHDNHVVNFGDHYQYFLCLPQHKEACLHWLNGGDLDFNSEFMGEWTEYKPFKIWRAGSVFMQEDYKIRIKPRKEKRWICITDNLEIEDGTLYESPEDANENSPGYKQIVEIEVEV